MVFTSFSTKTFWILIELQTRVWGDHFPDQKYNLKDERETQAYSFLEKKRSVSSTEN